ncbi:MAG: hypothetical protein LBT45_00920 [Rickettsiales bacterium]|jgi:hypothetical protein|nr:hypothetical protein [Rickettsiales bacterium]
MQAICSFCKTTFRVGKSGAGKCPVCGRRTGAPKKRSSPTAKLFVAALLFLLTSIFAVVSMNVFRRNEKSELLQASISKIVIAESGYIVHGNIRNFSENTYSIPDLVFVLKTDSGVVLNQIVQLPPHGLIEPMSDIEFVRVLTPKISGAGKISVRFATEGN